jgi:hypothetical protein
VVLAAGLVATATTPARAATKEQCVAAFEQTQKLQSSGKVVEARAQALVCVDDSCPEVVRTECIRWLRSIEEATPTLIVGASTADGRDVTDARVSLDGAVVLTHLGGTGFRVDPGEHTVVLEVPGQAPLQQRVVVNSGEKNRLVRFTLPAPAASTAPPPSAPAPSAPPPAPAASSPVLPWILGGIGIAALAAGGVLDGLTWQSLANDRSTCAPGCPPSDKTSLQTRFAIGDGLLLGGVIALGIGVGMLLFTPHHASAAGYGFGRTTAWNVGSFP